MIAEPTTFELPIDDDLLADLRAVGVELRPVLAHDGEYELPVGTAAVVPDDAARIDAMASVHLRRMAAIDADLQRHHAAFDLELETLKQRYQRRTEPLITELARHEAIVRDLARVQHDRGGFGKKKSRATGHGTYGVKAVPARLEVADETAFVAFAEKEAPELLRVTLKMPLSMAREYMTDAELEGVRREVLATPVKQAFADVPDTELPPGVRRTVEELETYARPEPLA